MSTSWRDDDEDFKVGGVKGALRSKPRFSITEVKLLLDAVKKNRCIILKKFNQGVSADAKKQTWAEITAQINALGENHREVRQIMKKWADLKCDGKRRIVALRGPNGSTLRKKNLGPVEKMVHKILMMSPTGDGNSDQEFDDDDLSKLYAKSPNSSAGPYSYLSMTDSSHSFPGGAFFEISPLSSPEKDLGGDPYHSSSEFDMDMGDDGDRTMDFDENDDSLFCSLPSSLPPPPPPPSAPLDPLPNNALLRVKPVHTYSRSSSSSQSQNNNNNHVQNHNSTKPTPGPSTSSDAAAASTSSAVPSASSSDAPLPPAGPPPSRSPTSSNATGSALPPPPPASSSTPAAASDTTSDPAPSPSTLPPPASSTAATSSPTFVAIAPSLSVLLSNPQQPPSSASSALPSGQLATPTSNPSDPLPAGASSNRSHDHVAQMAFQSVEQQRASRMLLTSVSQSLEVLAQSVQLLVESQQEFVQESLLLQRETVDILRDFSNTALTMLRDKSNSGQHPPPPRF